MTGFVQGFGLVIQTDIPLGGFAHASEADPDITIGVSDRARAAVEAAEAPPYQLSRSGPGSWCLHVPEIADYLMCDGSKIDVSPAPGVKDGHIELFLAGSALGAILHQRGLHCLHAATVEIDGSAIAFVGVQGAGKSTLAAKMAATGHRVLGDDVIVLAPGKGGIEAHPGAVRFKMWRESLDALGLSPGRQVGDRVEKFYVDPPGPIESAPSRLGAVVELRRAAETDSIAVERIPQLAAIDLVSAHTYRAEWIALMGARERHFEQCATVASHVPVWRLARPDGLNRLGPTCRWLTENWPMLVEPDR